ncbi:MAG: 3-hydroxyacyl-CoA dehydrogenase family protein [Deltaproteobacteria bacterium]|nr:3-hydroxyacyl-CoA dehydrogenase family protein [Deltaproteobacteria bacterium]
METKRFACVGAGLIGQGWATVFASGGHRVLLQDLSPEILERAAAGVKANLEFLERSGLLAPGESETAFSRLRTTLDLEEAVAEADYVQESVLDDYDLKRAVFKQMDAVAPVRAILASSASGLVMTEIQSATTRPERCVLVHPILPVHLIPVVEIVGGERTSPETVQKARDTMRDLGKIPVVLRKEVPGYIVNRLQSALLREAMDMVDKGVASAQDIDLAFCMGIGLRDPLVGPFLRIHLAGDGVERFIRNYAKSYEYRWKSMESWTSIPPSAREAVVKGVREMETVRTRSLEEIKKWRDGMLVEILKLVREHGR